MYMHREGYGSIGISFLVLLVIDIILWLFVPVFALVLILTIAFAIIWLWVISFFRIPTRVVTIDDGAIIAPADGKVVAIEETVESEYFNERRLQISIFMNITDVHANYIPIDGEVQWSAYHPGKYLVAWHPKSSALNERHTNVIRHEKYGDILVRQIAGAMARRIVNYLKKPMKVAQGEELGFIKFGSRVDLLLPLDVDVKVKMHDKVRSRQTVIARFSEK